MVHPAKAWHRQVFCLGFGLTYFMLYEPYKLCSDSSRNTIVPTRSETTSCLKIVRVQPIRSVQQQNVPHVESSLDWPTRGVPEPGFNVPRVSVADELCDVGQLSFGNVTDAAPPHHGSEIGGC